MPTGKAGVEQALEHGTRWTCPIHDLLEHERRRLRERDAAEPHERRPAATLHREQSDREGHDHPDLERAECVQELR
jgi:hypothetical protein